MALLTPLERVCLCCLIQLEIECVFPSSCLWFFHFSSVVMISNYNTVTVLDIRIYDFTSKTCYLVCFHIKRWYSCLCTFRRFSGFLGKHGEILTRSRLIHHDQQRRPSTTDEKQIWGKKMTTDLRRVSGSKSWGFVQSNLHICEQFIFMTSSWLYIYFHKREIGNSRGAGRVHVLRGCSRVLFIFMDVIFYPKFWPCFPLVVFFFLQMISGHNSLTLEKLWVALDKINSMQFVCFLPRLATWQFD